MLMIAGSTDRTTPAATVYAAYQIQRRSAGATQLTVFDRRRHSLPADPGWREIADTALRFLHHNGYGATVTLMTARGACNGDNEIGASR